MVRAEIRKPPQPAVDDVWEAFLLAHLDKCCLVYTACLHMCGHNQPVTARLVSERS